MSFKEFLIIDILQRLRTIVEENMLLPNMH